MFKIEKNNKMTLTRGDSAFFDVSIETDSGEEYQVGQGDQLVMTVKASTMQACPDMELKLTGSASFEIEPEDTRKMRYGHYMYDIQLTTGSGDVFTIVGPAPFHLCEEVTW